MEYFKGVQAVSYNDIADIISLSTLNINVYRGTIIRLRRACRDTEALYDVRSFPPKYRKAIKEKFGEEQQVKSAGLLDAETIRTDMQAVNYFAEFVLDDGRHLPTDKQEEYVNNASILNRCKEIYQASCEMRARTSGTRINKGEFWERVSKKLPELQEQMPHSLPSDKMRLQKKYNEYQKDGYKVLVNNKYMNRNSRKVDNEEKESVILTLLGDRRNLQNSQIAMIYNEMAMQMGWKAITESAVGVWREKYELESYAGRYGANKFRAYKTMQAKRSKPTLPMLYWTADSWDVELLYQKTTENKKGHNVTTYHNRLTVCVILDTHNKYPVGYAIGEYENPTLIRRALKDAVNHTKALFGERYIVNEFQSDRYGISCMSEVYKSVTANYVPARAHNAKAKVIEPYFKYLNDNYCHLMRNWSGYGVTSNKELQPNSDIPQALKKMFPTEEECAEQVAGIIEQERKIKQSDFVKGFAKLEESKRIKISEQQYLLQFGSVTGNTNKLEGSGLNITIEGVKHHYDCFDLDFRRYSYEDWTIKYDEEDLSKVLAVNSDGSRQYMLEEKYIQPMALADRQAGDSDELQRVFDFNKSIEAHVTEALCSAQQRTKELLMRNSGKLDETLCKMLITDSDGQHKNRRNENRITDEEIKAIDYKPVDFSSKEEEEEESLADLY